MNMPPTKTLSLQDLLKQLEQGLDVTFPTHPHAAYERRLIFDHLVEPAASTLRQRFEALAGALCDLLAQRWLLTSRTYDRENPKQVYYLSEERPRIATKGAAGETTPHGHRARDRLRLGPLPRYNMGPGRPRGTSGRAAH
jgi:hypothetical protein